MTAEPTDGGPNAKVVPLRAAESPTETSLGEAEPPAYVDTTGADAGARLPILPEPWRRENIRGTLAQLAGLHWHRTRYHGLRSPAYLALLAFYTARGAHRVTLRLLTWWHWTDGWLLESMAVAAGRAGHHEAMRAHTEGKRTRGTRGRIVGTSLEVALVAVLAMVQWSPWWGWALAGLTLTAYLARAGKPHGRPLIGAATVAPQYQPPTPEVITRALGSLNLAGINQALKDDGTINFVSDVHRDGPGWGAQLDLPYGVTATQILARREQLASGLRRRCQRPGPPRCRTSMPGGSSCGSASTTSPRPSPPPGRCQGRAGRHVHRVPVRHRPARTPGRRAAVRAQLAHRRRPRPGQDQRRAGRDLRRRARPADRTVDP